MEAMDENINQRLHKIHKMLLEMGVGNFYHRIERSESSDNIEALIVTFNMVIEEIQEAIIHQGYANRDTAILDIVQMSFILDDKGTVYMVNREACNILSIRSEAIIGKPFDNLLVEGSVKGWKETWKKFEKGTVMDTNIKLTFKSNDGLVIPKVAYLTKFNNGVSNHLKTLITIIHHSNHRNKRELDLIEAVSKKRSIKEKRAEKNTILLGKQKVRLNSDDIRKIREAHDLLINNPENEYPPLKDFALQLGTNEFKLKYGFKELYGKTVHDFLVQARLQKAQMMVQYSDHSFKLIAQMSGFNSLSHFSRSFKKKYGFSPSELRKSAV